MPTPKIFRIPFVAMACGCEVVLAAEDQESADRLARIAIEEVQRIETKYSRYRPDSIISRINAAAGREWLDCDQETWSLLEYAGTLFLYSDGLFDITSGVLRRAWDFKTQRIPSVEELSACLELVGWPGVELSRRKVRLSRTGMEIDFGGFGKEYAADRAGALLSEHGVIHGYVNLGGDMRFLGPKPDGQAWMIGIQDPRDKKSLLATLPISRGGLATSGDYERYFEREGKRYCHVLDPRSGQPVSHWRTISSIAPLAVVAGNCSTIAMLKQTEGLAFLEAAGVDYLAVDDAGQIHLNKRKQQEIPLSKAAEPVSS